MPSKPAKPAKKRPFWEEFIHDRDVAAISPSSSFLIQRLLRRLDFKRIRAVAELGPGDGVATAAILANLPADAKYVAIETNPVFAHALAAWPDGRLQVIEDDARNLTAILKKQGLEHVDLVVASIPFTYLSKDDRHKLVADVKSILTTGGKFIIFHQYSPLMQPYLKEGFGGRIHTEFEPLNVFPCFLMEGIKK